MGGGGWWWMVVGLLQWRWVVDGIFRVVVGNGVYFLSGGGWWWVYSGWWWVFFGWW